MPTDSFGALQTQPDIPLGQSMRERRLELGLTQHDVAKGAGLSIGFISQVERGHAAPSLSSLVAISSVLRSHVSRFLSQPRGESIFTRHDRRTVYGLAADAVHYERISASFPGSVLNGVITQMQPGQRIEPIQHEGEELLFILDGAITVEIDADRTVLEAGDSTHFASTRRHSTWNHTTSQATVMHVCTIDVFGDKSHEAPLGSGGSNNHSKERQI